MPVRTIIRRTQAQVDAQRKAQVNIETADRPTLQALAKERGIKANQSTDALRAALR